MKGIGVCFKAPGAFKFAKTDQVIPAPGFPGQFPGALDKAVFGAQKGQVVGPIKTQYGYYVFEVTKTTPGKQQSLNEAAQQIRSTLQQTAQQKAQTTFQTDFTDKWRKKTKCAKDFKVPAVCGNAPKPKAGSDEDAEDTVVEHESVGRDGAERES